MFTLSSSNGHWWVRWTESLQGSIERMLTSSPLFSGVWRKVDVGSSREHAKARWGLKIAEKARVNSTSRRLSTNSDRNAIRRRTSTASSWWHKFKQDSLKQQEWSCGNSPQRKHGVRQDDSQADRVGGPSLHLHRHHEVHAWHATEDPHRINGEQHRTVETNTLWTGKMRISRSNRPSRRAKTFDSNNDNREEARSTDEETAAWGHPVLGQVEFFMGSQWEHCQKSG